MLFYSSIRFKRNHEIGIRLIKVALVLLIVFILYLVIYVPIDSQLNLILFMPIIGIFLLGCS